MEVESSSFIYRHKLLLAVSLATMIFVLLLIPIIFVQPVLEINNEEITYKVFEEKKENGYNASYLGFNISNLVQITDDTDTNKVGEYKIHYSVEMGFNHVEKETVIHVIDDEAPVISLKGKTTVEVCDEAYKEDGYSASDNYDGDITSSVVVTKASDKYTYTVSDSSGNTTQVIRTINVCKKKETTKKADFYISLNGSQTIYIPLNNTYEEYGATAYDKTDGEITTTIEGNVDTSTPGHYSVTYSATNSAGETIQKTRNVYVFDTNTTQNLSGGEAGVIYLTFDDGPSAYTYEILKILDKYNIKATFFVTGSGQDDAIIQEYSKGHTVALHTYTHQWSIYTSPSTYFADLDKVSDRVYRLTGQRPMIIRFPGGSSNTVSRKYNTGIMTYLTSEVLKRGYHYFDWNVCVEDAGACAKKSTYEAKKTCVKNYFIQGLSKKRSNVVLMHDIKKYTMESLEEMIQYAIKEGYRFDKITMNTEQIHMRVNN